MKDLKGGGGVNAKTVRWGSMSPNAQKFLHGDYKGRLSAHETDVVLLWLGKMGYANSKVKDVGTRFNQGVTAYRKKKFGDEYAVKFAQPNSTLDFSSGPGGGGGYSGSYTASAQSEEEKKPVTENEIRAYLRKNFGYLAAFYDHPEIGDILRKSATKGWDEARMQGALFETKWWKKTSNSARQWLAITKTDPAEARRQRQKMRANISDLASKLGLDLTSTNSIAETALKMGWDDIETMRALATKLKYDPEGEYKGDIGTTYANVKKAGQDQLVQLSSHSAFNYAKQVALGQMDEDNLTSEMRNKAKSRFSYDQNIAAALDSGITAADYFDQHIQDTAQLLEVPNENIDLNDPKYSKITDFVDDKGVRRAMTRAEAQTYVRGLSDWSTTRQAHQEVADKSEQLLELFGQVSHG